MKKLILSICLFVAIGISANVMAQSTGYRPYIGETKTYHVTADATTNFTWTVTTSATDATTGDLLPAGAIVSAGSGYNGTAKNSISLTWVNPTLPTIYYLHVVADKGGCSNHKVLAIQPQNNFTLAVVNINSDNSGATLADPFVECAPTVTVAGWNGSTPVDDATEAQNFTYNYGTKYFYYRISANGINFATTTWTAKFAVADPTSAQATLALDYLIADDNTSTPSWTSPTAGAIGSTVTVNVPVNKKTIFVRVKVDNGTTNETLANQNFTLTLDATSKENLGNQPAIISDATSIQTQSSRPNIGNIIAD